MQTLRYSPCARLLNVSMLTKKLHTHPRGLTKCATRCWPAAAKAEGPGGSPAGLTGDIDIIVDPTNRQTASSTVECARRERTPPGRGFMAAGSG